MSRFLALLGGSRRCSDTTGIGGKADTCRDRFTPTPAQGNDPAANVRARGLTIPDNLIALADKSDQCHQRDGIGIVTKVLYVEHNDDNIYMLKTRLELLGGFEVLAAGDSESGCELAVTEHPDVILMDLEMPVVDRWEPVRRLKNDPQTRDIPIIGMSAHALESEREQAIATGCDEFDAKPIEFDSLVASIQRVLGHPK